LPFTHPSGHGDLIRNLFLERVLLFLRILENRKSRLMKLVLKKKWRTCKFDLFAFLKRKRKYNLPVEKLFKQGVLLSLSIVTTK